MGAPQNGLFCICIFLTCVFLLLCYCCFLLFPLVVDLILYCCMSSTKTCRLNLLGDMSDKWCCNTELTSREAKQVQKRGKNKARKI